MATRIEQGACHETSARDDERSDTVAIIPGYSFRLNPDIIIVTAFIREWEMERGNESDIAEVDARYQRSPR